MEAGRNIIATYMVEKEGQDSSRVEKDHSPTPSFEGILISGFRDISGIKRTFRDWALEETNSALNYTELAAKLDESFIEAEYRVIDKEVISRPGDEEAGE
jgi:hypothetical protein